MTSVIVNDPSGIHRSADPVPSELIWIVYGTHTGNSEQLAAETARYLGRAGLETKVTDMESFAFQDLASIRRLLIIVSTDGDGEPPIMAEDLLAYLHSDASPRLPNLRYSVLALGDTCYYRFCQTGKDFDSALQHLGAIRLMDRMDLDTDYDQDYQRWLESVSRTFQ